MSDNQSKKVSQRLLFARDTLHKTQSQFAKGAGISQSQVSEIEKGEKNITYTILCKIEDAYGISRHWLEKGEGEMFIPNNEEIISELKSRISELEAGGASVAAEGKIYYEPSINWQRKFVEVDEKYKAMLENRLLEFLIKERAAGSSA